MNVICVLGTRPEAIKLAPVIKELKAHAPRITTQVWATAQHREMLDQVTKVFDIQPDLDFNLMQPGQSLSEIAARVLQQLAPHLEKACPDWLLVQGDTTTVAAACLAAHYSKIKVGHVEAGLRSFNRQNPYPEEMNRVIADAISDLHFAPTPRARTNLLREGIPDSSIHVTGNTVIDALLDVASRRWIPPPTTGIANLRLGADSANGQGRPRLILVTAHRRESFGRPLRSICEALRTIALSRGPEVRVVIPVHLNPEVQAPVYEILSGLENVTLLPPLDYLSTVQLLKHCYLLLTDSGGLQEEAPSLGKPVLVLRTVTERPEAIEAGTALLVGSDPEVIIRETSRLLDDSTRYAAMAHAVNPFGDGHAAERIVKVLLDSHGANTISHG